MIEGEGRGIHQNAPEVEQTMDLFWIEDNLSAFWHLARQGFEKQGRGAVIANMVVTIIEGGHPYIYLPAPQVEEWSLTEAVPIVKEYDPQEEFVAVLLKHAGESVYRIKVEGQEADGSSENHGFPI